MSQPFRVSVAVAAAAFVALSLGCSGGPGVTAGVPLPADWPTDLPTYPGAEVMNATNGPGSDGADAWSATLQTTDATDKVHDFYMDAVKAPYAVTFDMSSGTTTGLNFATADQKSMIAVTADSSSGPTTLVAISLTRQR